MTQERDNDALESAEEEQGPQCGQRLAAARRAQNVSILDIAKELHISEDKVEALERNDFDMLGAAVFAKGYIRKYAQLVRLEDGDLLDEYEELASASNIVPVLKARPRPRREMSPGPWIAVIVAIILAATAYWWFTDRPFGKATVTPSSPVEMEPEPLPQSFVESPDDVDGGVESSDLGDDSAQQAEEPVESAVVEAAVDTAVVEAPMAEEPLDDGQLRMLLTFSGDCWTEISDGNGRRLFFGLGSDGRTVELSGEAPFNALFGNAANVRLEVNGVEYAIKDSERSGRTARLTVNGS